MVEQCGGLTPVLWRSDELPDEALDVFVATVVKQTKDQNYTTDRLHVTFAQTPFAPGVRKDVPPATPAGQQRHEHCIEITFHGGQSVNEKMSLFPYP